MQLLKLEVLPSRPMRIIVVALVLWFAATMYGLSQKSAAVTLSPKVPADLPSKPTQADAVTFAWQSFVALNWPALANQRGVPDPNRKIGDAGTVVWHTWKIPEEVFLPDGSVPAAWNTYASALPPECRAVAGDTLAPGDLVLFRTSKVSADTNGNNALELANEVVGGTLTDQRGNLARYDIRLNKTEFDAIVQNRYYNVQGQNAARVIQLPAGVMEVKASWRILPANDPLQSRFVQRPAWIYTPANGPQPAVCTSATVGLTGLHITQKTPTRPQWIWATFEQIDNVPPFGGKRPPGRTLPYSFNNPGCPILSCPPNQSTEDGRLPTTPTQVTRVIDIGAEASAANQVWRGALKGTRFEYYELVDVQWPKTPVRRPFGDPTPGLLANTTMETYIEDSSCLHCHFTARTQSGKLSSDFTFMLAKARPAQERP